MRHTVLTRLVHLAERPLGRRRLAQLARLVTMEVRLDTTNDITANGEAAVQQWALRRPAPVVLDVGAHFGEWSQALLSHPGGPPVLHAFEPSATTAARARDALGERATVHQLALSDQPGSGTLHVVHEGAGSNSVVAFTSGAADSNPDEEITLDTVDRFCAAQGLEQVTLLKVDAEGHDLAVLRGAREMLGRQAIDFVQFEYNSRWIDARSFLLDAFELLAPLGYRMGKVTPRGIETYPRWHPELEKFVEANYLAYLPELEGAITTLPWWGG